jgi:hypothetical protein
MTASGLLNKDLYLQQGKTVIPWAVQVTTATAVELTLTVPLPPNVAGGRLGTYSEPYPLPDTGATPIPAFAGVLNPLNGATAPTTWAALVNLGAQDGPAAVTVVSVTNLDPSSGTFTLVSGGPATLLYGVLSGSYRVPRASATVLTDEQHDLALIAAVALGAPSPLPGFKVRLALQWSGADTPRARRDLRRQHGRRGLMSEPLLQPMTRSSVAGSI